MSLTTSVNSVIKHMFEWIEQLELTENVSWQRPVRINGIVGRFGQSTADERVELDVEWLDFGVESVHDVLQIVHLQLLTPHLSQIVVACTPFIIALIWHLSYLYFTTCACSIKEKLSYRCCDATVLRAQQ